MRLRLASTAVISALVVAGAACGGSDKPSTGGTPAVQSSGSIADDLEIAESALLTLDDFPAGWEETAPDPDDSDDDTFSDRFAECLEVDSTLINKGEDGADAEWPDFRSPTDQEVSNSISFAPADADAAEFFEILSRPDAPDCLAEALKTVVAQQELETADETSDVEIGEVTVDEVEYPTLGDDTIALRMTLPVTSEAEDISIDVYGDLLFFRVGRAGAFLTFLDFGTPFPITDSGHYARIVERRLVSALG